MITSCIIIYPQTRIYKNTNPLMYLIPLLIGIDDDRDNKNGIVKGLIFIIAMRECALFGRDSDLPHHGLQIVYKFPLILKQMFYI